MSTLELNGRKWRIGSRIGADQGGMGEVYVANCDGQEAAVKFIPRAPGADREMLFVELSGASNIVPVLDSGDTDSHHILVMPLATESLIDKLERGPLLETNALAVLSDVATALASLHGRVVHRDLKPGNILLVDGVWCIADFGISRYAEASTAPDTRKFRLTPPYASPEQWRGEHATGAADVYAFGVVAYELVAGQLPFPGPMFEDFRDQHLHAEPPSLQANAQFASLVDTCLLKSPGARPTPQQLLERLHAMRQSGSRPGLARLQEANRALERRRAEFDRVESRNRTLESIRADLWVSSVRVFDALSREVREVIAASTPAAAVKLPSDRGYSWSIHLDTAELKMSHPEEVEAEWSDDQDSVPFDVVAAASISVTGYVRRDDYEGRSHSLWYCDALEEGRFEWYEVAFTASQLVRRNAYQYRVSPHALTPRGAASSALMAADGDEQVAWPFTPLVPGDLDDFIERWADLLAEGSVGPLSRPRRMPERDVGVWRSG